MAPSYVNFRNLQFLLNDVFDAPGLRRFARYQDYEPEVFALMLDAAHQIGETYLFPYYREMDRQKAYFDGSEVRVHPALKPAIKAIAEAGWIGATDDYDHGGQQMPLTLMNAGLFIFYAANANMACYAFLTQGAANLIRSFGAEALNAAYVPLMYAGDWQGTMALTEPQAGSSLSDIMTSAEPVDAEGNRYRIRGQKIYISGGDHTAVDNVVHLLLARIKGAPAGVKGISLFVVPKLRPENGALHPNGVTTAGIYGKMGQKGYVAAHLMLGEQEDCYGFLVGKPHHGLSYMFQMMNEARIGTGLVSAGTASAAYYAALKYANERPQGRHPSSKDLSHDQVLIIEHADVRRMLLFQKAVVEGSISLLLQCSYYADVARAGSGTEAEEAHLILELLTPVAKSYPSETGTLAVSAGMQVLGGAGYTDDFPLEQYYRDIRVNAIYEGTTGIHGLDLLGRKVMMNEGRALSLFMKEVQKTLAEARKISELQHFAQQLEDKGVALQRLTMHLAGLAKEHSPEIFLADATLYLEYFGIFVMAWQWLKQAIPARLALQQQAGPGEEFDFYQGKFFAFQYFFEYELPKMEGLYLRLCSDNRLTLDIKNAFIN